MTAEQEVQGASNNLPNPAYPVNAQHVDNTHDPSTSLQNSSAFDWSSRQRGPAFTQSDGHRIREPALEINPTSIRKNIRSQVQPEAVRGKQNRINHQPNARGGYKPINHYFQPTTSIPTPTVKPIDSPSIKSSYTEATTNPELLQFSNNHIRPIYCILATDKSAYYCEIEPINSTSQVGKRAKQERELWDDNNLFKIPEEISFTSPNKLLKWSTNEAKDAPFIFHVVDKKQKNNMQLDPARVYASTSTTLYLEAKTNRNTVVLNIASMKYPDLLCTEDNYKDNNILVSKILQKGKHKLIGKINMNTLDYSLTKSGCFLRFEATTSHLEWDLFSDANIRWRLVLSVLLKSDRELQGNPATFTEFDNYSSIQYILRHLCGIYLTASGIDPSKTTRMTYSEVQKAEEGAFRQASIRREMVEMQQLRTLGVDPDYREISHRILADGVIGSIGASWKCPDLAKELPCPAEMMSIFTKNNLALEEHCTVANILKLELRSHVHPRAYRYGQEGPIFYEGEDGEWTNGTAVEKYLRQVCKHCKEWACGRYEQDTGISYDRCDMSKRDLGDQRNEYGIASTSRRLGEIAAHLTSGNMERTMDPTHQNQWELLNSKGKMCELFNKVYGEGLMIQCSEDKELCRDDQNLKGNVSIEIIKLIYNKVTRKDKQSWLGELYQQGYDKRYEDKEHLMQHLRPYQSYEFARKDITRLTTRTIDLVTPDTNEIVERATSGDDQQTVMSDISGNQSYYTLQSQSVMQSVISKQDGAKGQWFTNQQARNTTLPQRNQMPVLLEYYEREKLLAKKKITELPLTVKTEGPVYQGKSKILMKDRIMEIELGINTTRANDHWQKPSGSKEQGESYPQWEIQVLKGLESGAPMNDEIWSTNVEQIQWAIFEQETNQKGKQSMVIYHPMLRQAIQMILQERFRKKEISDTANQKESNVTGLTLIDTIESFRIPVVGVVYEPHEKLPDSQWLIVLRHRGRERLIDIDPSYGMYIAWGCPDRRILSNNRIVIDTQMAGYYCYQTGKKSDEEIGIEMPGKDYAMIDRPVVDKLARVIMLVDEQIQSSVVIKGEEAKKWSELARQAGQELVSMPDAQYQVIYREATIEITEEIFQVEQDQSTIDSTGDTVQHVNFVGKSAAPDIRQIYDGEAILRGHIHRLMCMIVSGKYATHEDIISVLYLHRQGQPAKYPIKVGKEALFPFCVLLTHEHNRMFQQNAANMKSILGNISRNEGETSDREIADQWTEFVSKIVKAGCQYIPSVYGQHMAANRMEQGQVMKTTKAINQIWASVTTSLLEISAKGHYPLPGMSGKVQMIERIPRIDPI